MDKTTKKAFLMLAKWIIALASSYDDKNNSFYALEFQRELNEFLDDLSAQ